MAFLSIIIVTCFSETTPENQVHTNPLDVDTTAHRTRSVEIVGGFLDGARFDFTDGLNCLIGARGAGKTTVVEWIRFALDELPSRDARDGERRRIETLVERNMGGGRVQPSVETKEGLAYIVSRSAGEEPIVQTPFFVPRELRGRSPAKSFTPRASRETRRQGAQSFRARLRSRSARRRTGDELQRP
ncbi:MAG: AAA family ATPase [Pirellulaceae bacterium]